MNSASLLLPSAYLAPISYFSLLYKEGIGHIEVYEHYTKQTIRNRCFIATANGVSSLSIPVVKPSHGRQAMKDVCISDHGNWQRVHWEALQSAYGRSPFFEYYEEDFYRFYHFQWKYLVDFNDDLTSVLCNLLDIECRIQHTQSFQGAPSSSFTMEEPMPYYQVFKEKHGFIPNLSVVDLLFNMGPESILYL